MKRLLLAALVLLSTPAMAQNFPEHRGQPVIDAANIIPDDREAALNQKLAAFRKQTTEEIAVATVPSLGGLDVAAYGIKYFEKLGVGNKDLDNGVLFLIAPNERQIRIDVGDGFQGTFNDIEAARILRDTVKPYFKAGDMVGGIEAGTDAIIKEVTPLTAEQKATFAALDKAKADRREKTMNNIIEFFLTVALIAGLVGAIYAIYYFATLPARRRRAAEKKRLDDEARALRIAEQAERDRRDAEARALARAEEAERSRKAAQERERQRLAAEAKRQKMLDDMSPTARATFLAREEADRIAAAAAAAEARRQQAAREERDRQERAARRRKEEEEAADRRRRDSYSSSSSSSSSSDSSSSSSNSYDFGGGSSSGGGASDSY